MKKLTVLLFLLSVSLLTFAQQTQVATLQHNDTITGSFYGSNALADAYTAAVDGDIITLSSGSFIGFEIYKSITIHGAGCVYDSLTGLAPTIITSNVKSSANNISFEGILFTGSFILDYSRHNNTFLKCYIEEIATLISNGTCYYENWQFINCIIKSFKIKGEYRSFRSMSLINSVVRFEKYYHNSESNPTNIRNSVVLFDSTVNINNIVAFNSIIATSSGHAVSNCAFYNCIGIKTGETSLFEGQSAYNVMEVDGYEDVFKTFAGTVSYDEKYRLKEEIATDFLGDDGKEVGIYGGVMPYRTRPNYMIIKNCNVASQTDANKKLSVQIELLNSGE